MMAATVGIALLQRSAAPPAEQSLSWFVGAAFVPLQTLLPVVAVLAVTAEWTHGTAVTTFTLAPQRLAVATAKLVAALSVTMVAALAALGVGYGAAASTSSAAGSAHAVWDLTLAALAGTVARIVVFVLLGLGIAFLLRHGAGAIVAFFLLPLIVDALAANVPSFQRLTPWVTLDLVLDRMASGVMAGADWAHLASSVTIWVLVPLVLGLARLSRTDII